MPKASNLPSLNLTASKRDDGSQPLSPRVLSPRLMESPVTPQSASTASRTLESGTPSTMQFVRGNSNGVLHDPLTGSGSMSPRLTAGQDFPPSPEGHASPKHSRDASKSFFSNFMASKSSHRLQSPEPGGTDGNLQVQGRNRADSKDRSHYTLKKQISTPDLSRIISSNEKGLGDPTPDFGLHHSTPSDTADVTITKQKSRSKLGGILNRSKGHKQEDERRLKGRVPAHLNLESHSPIGEEGETPVAAVRSAPPKPEPRERTLRADADSTRRNRSADRVGLEDGRRSEYSSGLTPSSSLRENPSLLSNLQQTGRGVSDRLGRAGRGIFNKMTRSGSTNEREPVTDDNYVCTTINLPLVVQTRKTRIAKRLELSKDKTEFWMPALPWRCIDYLNMQCEEEGLYRVPGSGRDVKLWERRFDTEYDINLFEEPELYDVNTIASMFKRWLRDLPDEILPKATQNKIAHQCAGATRTPQLLKDELSKLPPFHYYLLFAITCHLSLLHSYSDKNKMDYRNLCICFQPCLRIDAFCFQFLVIDWKECWQQGCWTEKKYLEEEYRWEREGSFHDDSERSTDERAISSSGSSQAVAQNQPPGSADGHRNPPPAIRPKQRSLSSSTSQGARQPSHGNTQTAPAIPRLVQATPEQAAVPDQELPEVGNLSPIRM